MTIRVKAVPGASRDSIAGLLGDRVKVRISAPPEGGKANKAIVKLFARSLGCKPAQVSIVSGQTNPEKIVSIDGVDVVCVFAAHSGITGDTLCGSNSTIRSRGILRRIHHNQTVVPTPSC